MIVPRSIMILSSAIQGLWVARTREGMYTWRHDSVLQVFVQGLQQDLPLCYKLYADLPGHLASISPPSTVPSGLSSSLSRPDIVLISDDCITLLELSVITNTSNMHLLAANIRKEDCYSSLLLDLAHAGLSVELVTIKVICLGNILPSSIANVCRVCHLSKYFTRCLNKLLKLLFRAPIEFLMHVLQSCWMLVNC